METLIQDLRYSLRQLGRAPGLAITVVLTLALGIGATASIFTLVYDVMLKPLPYRKPQQLVVIEEQVAEVRNIYPRLPVNANHFVDWQRNSRSFQSMAAMFEGSMPLGTGGHPLQIEVVSATPGVFAVLGAAPQIGRPFTEQEAVAGRDRVVVLMHDLWRTQFQSDPRILGRTITLNGFPYTVIGVMPASFHLPIVNVFSTNGGHEHPVEAILPLVFTKEQLSEAMGYFSYFGLGRLKPGVTPAQANAELDALQHRISASLLPQDKGTLAAVLTPFQQAVVGNNRTPLLILLAAVAGLLLVGCVNITNLLLSRAVSRRQPMAVAAALGASRSQMLRMAMGETATLAALGGALGILLAAILVPVMQRYLPTALDFRGPLHLDWTGATCALLLAVAATLVAGAAPAWMGARTQPLEALRGESRLAGESRASKRLRRILVAVEAAVSVALVLTTGLLIASFARLMHTDHGFEAAHVVTAEVDLPSQSYTDQQTRTAFYTAVLSHMRQIPGVKAAGLISMLPLAGDEWIDEIRVAGDVRPFMELPTEHFRFISPGYFQAIHLPLVAGRPLSVSDYGKFDALISQRTAHTLWPGENAVGRHFVLSSETEQFTIIGVVKDARTITLARPDPLMVYVPYWYLNNHSAGFVVRTRQGLAATADAMRKAVWSVDPAASVPLVRTLGGVVADSVENRRFEMDLLLLFAVSALLLAGLGVYGVVTYSVVQRRQEFGLRLALGAQRAGIYTLVLRDGLTPVLAGAAAGACIAFVFAHLIASLLFQVSPYNPVIAIAAIGVLIAAGVAACLLPARRAATVDPMQTLRTE